MRTLEEIDRDLDKVKAEFDILLAEKSKAQTKAAKYFMQDVTITFYTKDEKISDQVIDEIEEYLGNMDQHFIMKIDKGWPFPITQEEYEKADA